jgi:hypothetical protein
MLKALGVPWPARAAILRSRLSIRIAHEGEAWVEASTTAVVTKTQTLVLDGTERRDTNPLDKSVVVVWSSAGGARPPLAPPLPSVDAFAEEGGAGAPPPPGAAEAAVPEEAAAAAAAAAGDAAAPPPAVISVMHYLKTGNVATITRTLEDDGMTYHVRNELLVKEPPDTVVNDKFFARVPDDDEVEL